MAKQAQLTEELLIKMILALIGLAILFFLAVYIGSFVLRQIETSNCEMSISKSAADGLPSFNCRAKYSEIKKSDFATSLRPEDLDAAVKKEVANKMWECASLAHKALFDPYRDSFEISRGFVAWNDEPVREFYLLCDIISFKNIPSFKGLNYFMALNPPASNKVTYFDFMHGRVATEDELKELVKAEDVYDTSKRYVIAWNYSSIKYPLPGKTEQNVIFVPYSELAGDKQSGNFYQIVMN